jgi:hypothetical protein
VFPKCLPTPRLFKCAPVRQSGEGNYGTAKVDGRTSNAVCSPGRRRKWAIICVGRRGRHRFGRKPSRAGIPSEVGRANAIFLRVLCSHPVSPNNAIISRLNAGMSSGLRLVTNPFIRSDVFVHPCSSGVRMSVLSEGHEVSVQLIWRLFPLESVSHGVSSHLTVHNPC